MTTIHFSKIIELSHPLEPGMPAWPGDPTVSFEAFASLPQDGYALRAVRLGEHSGTHLNAPSHMVEGRQTVDGIPAERLVLPAVVIENPSADHADYADITLQKDDVLYLEKAHGPVPTGCLVIFYTGWQSRWTEPIRYLNPDDAGGLHFPGFGLDAAQFLVEERGVAGLGIDAPSIERGRDKGFSVNRYALARNVLVLENLANLDQLPPVGAWLVIGRLPLVGGTGAPASVLALVP